MLYSFLTSFSLWLFIAPAWKISDQEAVIQADRELNALTVNHQVSQASSYYADEFILTTSSGKTKLKKEMLDEIASSNLQLEINETTHVTVRVLQKTAVLTGVLHQKGIYNNKPFDVKLTVTDTWVKAGNRWKILSGHASLLP